MNHFKELREAKTMLSDYERYYGEATTESAKNLLMALMGHVRGEIAKLERRI